MPDNDKQKGVVVSGPVPKVEAIVTVLDKHGKVKGKMKFTNDPEDMQHEVKHRRTKRDP